MANAPKVDASRRRRPKDRKEQIFRVSAEAFSQLGYHGVSMDDIARGVGVTATSLYRHYARKYDLFQSVVLGLGEQLVECTAFIPDDDRPADEVWDAATRALIATTIRNRNSGGLYRWEGRYLEAADQAVLNGQIKLVNRRLQRPLSQLRPSLTSRQRWILSSAVLSAIGSITDHRAALRPADIHTTLSDLARRIRDTELPAEVMATDAVPRRAVGAAAGEYEQILYAAMKLFNEHGYRDTGMDDIADEIGIGTTRIYRYFPAKGAILGAAYRRAADRVSGDLADILADTADPHTAIERFVTAYVRRSFANPELAYVYYAERVNVPDEDRLALRSIQRATVEAWVRQVVAATPGLDADRARFMVHAAFALVVDLGRLMNYERTEFSQATVRQLSLTVLTA